MDGGWVRLRLDVEQFDPGAFATDIDRCRRAGIEFTTIAALGDDDANRRRLYELNRVCSADIPGRGEFYPYPEYLAERIDVASWDPGTVVLAIDGDEWVGMSAASDHRDERYFFNEMTGVVRSHRRRGIALALKVLVIERVRALGVPAIHTVHHAANVAPITLNRKLGYVEADGRPTADDAQRPAHP
jgi:GNAT superfamily N-acetyltransferase